MVVTPVEPADLLEVWERGRHASPGQRALFLLEGAVPGAPLEALGQWSVGRRDAALLDLRRRVFGPDLVALAACPGCEEQVETTFSAATVLVEPATPPATITLEQGDYRVVFRLPNAGDMAALAAARGDPVAWLLDRCILHASVEGAPRTARDLPPDVAESVSRAMADADPQAEIELQLTCPTCGTRWRALFDVAGFLWRETEAWARRTLHDVATLASAFGWSERAILDLSEERRRSYLEIVRG